MPTMTHSALDAELPRPSCRSGDRWGGHAQGHPHCRGARRVRAAAGASAVPDHPGRLRGCCWPGCARTASWTRSGSRAPGPTGPVWRCICGRPGSSWSRSTARTARPAAGRASPTRSTPRPPPAPPRPAGPPASRRTAAGRSRRCARCGWPAAARWPPAPRPRRQMKALIVTAPDPLRSQLRGLGDRQLIAHCATRRPDRAAAARPDHRHGARAARPGPPPPAAVGRDRRARRADRPAGHRDQPRPVRAARGRPRRRRTAAGHRRGQPATAARGGGVRDALRGRPAARLVRAHPPPPAQPRRGPPSQRRALPDRALPAALGPPHPRLRRNAAPPRACPRKRSSAASSATSPARSTPPCSTPTLPPSRPSTCAAQEESTCSARSAARTNDVDTDKRCKTIKPGGRHTLADDADNLAARLDNP